MHAAKQEQNQSQIYKLYFKTKQLAKLLEEDNNSKLILFPSASGEKDEWLKMGGSSALFYKYLIAPRLNKKSPTIRPDTDLSHRFKDGIISIHWKNLFLKNLTKIGLPPPHEENGLLIVELNHKFTQAEIKKLKSREKEKHAEINQILKPKNSIPELYHILLVLAKSLPPKVAKLKEPYRNDFGSQINHTVCELFITYTDYVDKNITSLSAKSSFHRSVNKLNALLIILNENKLLDYSTIGRVGRTLLDLRETIERTIKDANDPK